MPTDDKAPATAIAEADLSNCGQGDTGPVAACDCGCGRIVPAEAPDDGLGDALAKALLTIPCYLIYGRVTADIWVWFVVPLGVKPVPAEIMAGLWLLWYFIVPFGGNSKAPSSYERILNRWFVYPLIVWGIAWILAKVVKLA